MEQTDSKIRAYAWSVTINNPSEDDRISLQTKPQFVRKLRGQEEVGSDTGTQHIQMVVFTDQVRMSSMKRWLSRAHFKPAFTDAHKDNLWKYTHKVETAVPGTQFEWSRPNQDTVSIRDRLVRLAEYAWDQVTYNGHIMNNTYKDNNAMLKAEYWSAVNKVLKQEPDLITVYSMDMLQRAWINTRQIWVNLSQNPETEPPEEPVLT